MISQTGGKKDYRQDDQEAKKSGQNDDTSGFHYLHSGTAADESIQAAEDRPGDIILKFR